MGGVSRHTHAATFPPDRFYCLLDELPLHLIPQPSRGLLQNDRGKDLVFNSNCMLCTGDDVPEDLVAHRQLCSAFALQGTIAWVREPWGEFRPFWLGPRFSDLVHQLGRQAAISAEISESTAALLLAAGILVPAKSSGAKRRVEQIAKAAAEFHQNGYAPLAGLIHPFHVAALRRYYRQRIRSGAIQLGDRQSERRYVVHNDPVARFFHQQLASTLSEVTGEALKPSYVYTASYLSGAELKKHTDREQCEFSITLCLDFSPEPSLATPWPIHLETPHGVTTVYQALGDGLAYRGTRLPHYRSVLAEGQTSTSIFFHYVGSDFAGSLS